MPNERADLQALQGVLEKVSQFRCAHSNARLRDDGDVLAQRRLQPHAFCGFRVDEQHRTDRAIAVIGVNHVGPDDDPWCHAPVATLAADPDAAFDGDDDLNRVMFVGRNDPFTASERDEPTVPGIPVRRAGPPRWR